MGRINSQLLVRGLKVHARACQTALPEVWAELFSKSAAVRQLDFEEVAVVPSSAGYDFGPKSEHARNGINPADVDFANGGCARVVEVLAEVADRTDVVLLFDPESFAREEVRAIPLDHFLLGARSKGQFLVDVTVGSLGGTLV